MKNEPINVRGIGTSCDESSAAVAADGKIVKSSVSTLAQLPLRISPARPNVQDKKRGPKAKKYLNKLKENR